MAASVQFRPQNRNLGMVMREVDEDLAIFLGMRNGEKEKTENLMENCDEIDDSTEPKPDGLLEPNVLQPEIVQIAANDNFLNLEFDRNDYDWLYMQPDSSSLPSVELGVQDSAENQTENSNGEGNSKSELDASNHVESSADVNRKTTLSGDKKQTPRAATPTGRSALPAKSKPSRASTPTSKATFPSSKTTATQARSSTPVRATPRSSTPVGRPLIPVRSKPALRPATPTHKPATPLTTSGVFGTDRSSSGRKTGSTILKNPVASRGTSPTVRSRPSKPSEMLSLSQDAPENSKTLMPRRPASASRGRPSAPATNLSFLNGKPRQKSCSPAKVRVPGSIGNKNGSMMLSRSRGHSDSGDDVNPVLMGTKMVERVVNMRKLAPPKQEEYVSQDNPKKSSQENSGFGRSLSKKSLDMAIRHMDIRRTIPDNLRPIATGGISSGSAKSITVGVTESPSTSSSESSKSSISINSRFLDGNEMYDSFSCDSKYSTASSQ